MRWLLTNFPPQHHDEAVLALNSNARNSIGVLIKEAFSGTNEGLTCLFVPPGTLQPFDLLKPDHRSGLPITQGSPDALRACAGLSPLLGQLIGCAAAPEPEAVLF